MALVYYEGRFVSEHEGVLPVSDRGLQAGDGAYATIQVREGTPLFLETHLEQLYRQCHSFHLQMPSVTRELVEEVIERNQAFEGIWRLKILITGGDAPENRLPVRQGRVIILLQPYTPFPFKPLALGVFPIPYTTCHASFKSLAHLNRYYVMEEAHRQGLDDCITLTESGDVLEASFGNLFWVQEKTVFTPSPELPLYFGVTIRTVVKIAQELGFHIEYVKHKLAEIPKEAAPFRTNTMQGIRPIERIAEHAFHPNPVIQTLFLDNYESIIQKQKKTELLRKVPL